MPASRVGGEGQPIVPPGVSWLSPAVVMALAAQTERTVTLAPATATPILDADPERVAFGVLKSTALGSMPKLSPFPDVSVFALREDANTDFAIVTLQDWFTLVCNQWFAFSTAGGSIRIVEWRTPTL